MTNIRFSSPDASPPTAGYSHVAAVPAQSRLLFVSGQVAMDEEGAIVGRGDWEVQMRQVMRNVQRALEAAQATWADVVKLTFFVTDTSALTTVRAVRDEFVNTASPPTSSLFQVVALAHPDLLVEIEAVAAVAADTG